MSLIWMRSAHLWIHRHHTGSPSSAEATQLLLWPQASYRQWTRPAFPPSGTTRNRNMPETCLPWRWKPVTPSNLQVLTHISRRELLMVTAAEYDPQQEFHLSFSFSEAFGLSKSISLPQASWSHAGICSLPAGKPEELCPATMHPLKPHRSPQLQPGQLLLHGTTCICRGPSK